MEFQLNSQLDDIENAFGCPDEDYCNCRSSQAKDIMQILYGPKEEIQFPECGSVIHNPRPMANITKEPEPGSHDRTMAIMFPEGITERPGQIAAELWRDKPEPKNQIDLGQIPESEPEPVDPIAALILNRVLNRQELAAKLLVPEEKESDK